eukprot:COSAG02_NODE_53756_length_300_cov_0.402985_1_plen_92_part_10
MSILGVAVPVAVALCANKRALRQTCTFYFQCTKPDAIGVDFAAGRTQEENVGAVLADILGHGNATNGTLLPGQIEAESARLSELHGGLLFTA